MRNEDIEKNLEILQNTYGDTPVTYVIREMVKLNSQFQNKEIDEKDYQIKTNELWNKSKEMERAYSIKFYRTYDDMVMSSPFQFKGENSIDPTLSSKEKIEIFRRALDDYTETQHNYSDSSNIKFDVDETRYLKHNYDK